MINLQKIPKNWSITFEEFCQNNGITDFSFLSKAQKKRLLDFKYMFRKRQRDYGILYYRAQPYQQAFHKSAKKIRLVLGGNQTGKTEVGIAEDVRTALNIDPFDKFSGDKYPLRLRLIATDIKKGIGEVFMPKLQKLLPQEQIARIEKYQTGQWSKIFLKNESTLELLSYEQDAKLFESWTGHFAHFDEPPPQNIFTATYRGLMRFKGKIIITATPLNEPWIYDEVFLPGVKGSDEIDVFQFSIFDNKYLSLEEIKSFLDKVPDDEIDARAKGQFKHLTGLVYKEFSHAHCVDGFKIPKDWGRICAMDYHPRKPCVIVWIAVAPDDTYYVYDELETQGTVEQIAEKIAAKEQESGGAARFRFIDSISATPDRNTGSCPQKDFIKAGQKLNHPLLFRSSTKNFVSGKNAVSEKLRLINQKAGIYFFKDCAVKTIESLSRYVWANANTKGEDLERPKKVYDDFPDALRYAVVLRLTYAMFKSQEDKSYLEAYYVDVNPTNEHIYNSCTGYNLGG